LALGLAELEDETPLKQERIRPTGSGRKSALEKLAGLNEAFLQVLEPQKGRLTHLDFGLNRAASLLIHAARFSPKSRHYKKCNKVL